MGVINARRGRKISDFRLKSTSEMVWGVDYEEALYQVYAPLPYLTFTCFKWSATPPPQPQLLLMGLTIQGSRLQQAKLITHVDENIGGPINTVTVRHIPVLCLNGESYLKTVLTVW